MLTPVADSSHARDGLVLRGRRHECAGIDRVLSASTDREPHRCPANGHHVRVKRVFVLRHAKSSWSDDTLADHDRPLADRAHQLLVRTNHSTRLTHSTAQL